MFLYMSQTPISEPQSSLELSDSPATPLLPMLVQPLGLAGVLLAFVGLVSKVKKEQPVTPIHFAQEPLQLEQEAGVPSGATPFRSVISVLRIDRPRWVFAIVKDLIQGKLKSLCCFLKRLDGWNSVPILNP